MAVEQPTLIYSPHPLLPAADREARVVPFLPGESLGAYLERAGLPVHAPLVVSIDHYIVPRDQWSRTPLADGQIVQVRAALEKGSAGILLSIGLSVVAPGIGTAIGASVGLTGTAFTILGQAVTWGGLIGGIISIGGNLLIGSLFSPASGPNRSTSW